MEILLLFLGIALAYAFNKEYRRVRRAFRRDVQPTKPKSKPPTYVPRTPQTRAAPERPIPPVEPRRKTPEVITGKCYVIDGDTIVINKTHIRLFGIDAPELNHPWGKKAKWEMVNICKGRVITATLDGSSSHNRVVATCRLPDGTDLSEELVRRGLAIDWPKFSGGHYAQFEVEGIRKKLWRCHYRQLGKFFEADG